MLNEDASKPPLNPKPRGSLRRIAFATVGTLLVVVFILLITPWARDVSNAFLYEEPADVAQLSSKIDMTSKGQFLFRASQPELLDRDGFNQRCQQYEKGTSILGCYANGKIYIFDIDNPKLENSKIVTAAHELLHAAYERLPSSKKAELEPLLDQVYQQIKDPDLEKRMDMYDRNEPGQKYNELHSIIGTEFADIPQELEDYYKLYFNNRLQVVEYEQDYQKVFSDLENQAKALQQWLESHQAIIEKQMASYEASEAAYTRASQQLKSDASRLDRTDPEAVDAYNQRVDQLRNQRDRLMAQSAQINTTVDEYNQKVKQLNAINDKTKGLFDSMNSHPIDNI